MNRFQNPLTPEKVLAKAQKFCLYRERSEAEMERKIKEWGANQEVMEITLDRLIADRFISNERFAMAYARGKFNVKRWGKIKIRQGLKMHKIPSDLIEAAMLQINDKLYLEALEHILVKKMPQNVEVLSNQERFETKGALYRTAAQKGYESSLIMKVIDQLFRE
jgi:regulatory protein